METVCIHLQNSGPDRDTIHSAYNCRNNHRLVVQELQQEKKKKDVKTVCGLSLWDGQAKGVQRTEQLAPVVQKLDSSIHRINHFPVDKC